MMNIRGDNGFDLYFVHATGLKSFQTNTASSIGTDLFYIDGVPLIVSIMIFSFFLLMNTNPGPEY